MRRTARDEAGSTHVLEAVIIASIMVSAVAFVATFETPRSNSMPARVGLDQQAADALKILAGTPIEDNTLGDNALSVYLAECMQGDCSDFKTKLAKLLPPGASYAIYVSNGYVTFPVLVEREPSGEAVTVSQALEPNWSNSFVSTAIETVDPAQDPLVVYTLPLYKANPVSAGGSPLFVRVTGTRSDGSDYVLTSFHTTYAHAAGDPQSTAASLSFVDSTGRPLAWTNVTQATLDASRVPTKTPVAMTLRLEESEGGVVPAGTQLVLFVPRGWSATSNATLNGADWVVAAEAADRNGTADTGQIVARLGRSVSAEALDFHFDAVYHGDLVDYYPFVAELSSGTAATATVLVRGDLHATQPSFEVPGAYLSVPRPMGDGASTTWTLAAHVPLNSSRIEDTIDYGGLPSGSSDELVENVTIHTVEIIEQDGKGIFGGVTTLYGEAGTWTNGGDSLVWRGSVAVSQDRPFNLSFSVSASGTRSAPPLSSGLVPPVTFDSWSGRIVGRSGQGFFRGTFLPDDAGYSGYSTGAGGTSLEDMSLRSDALHRSTLLPGSTTYQVGPSTSVEDSLHGSYVGVERRSVPIGSEVVLTANVQSLLFKLAAADQEAGVTLRFYAPWSGDSRTPVYTQQNLDRGVLSGDVAAMVTLDVNGDGWPDPIVGTTNGRVLAYHAITGQRLQGNTFTVPLRAGSTLTAAPSVTCLDLLEHGGKTYILVGTNGASTGLFVLNSSFGEVWSYDMQGAATLAVDASSDYDGDGVVDIVAAREYESNALLYALKVPDFGPFLEPIPPTAALLADADAFWESPGTPSALVGMDDVGPFGDRNGFAVSRQTTVDGGVRVYPDYTNPKETSVQEVPLSTPRSGLQVVDSTGEGTSTLFGSPITLAQRYDYNGDAVTDLLSAGPGGYVFMSNGTALTQPIYSYVVSGTQTFIDVDARTSVEAYTLTDDGQVLYTDDAWSTIYCASCETQIPSANAVAASRTNEIWAVGAAGAIWRSVSVPLETTTETPHYLGGVTLAADVTGTFWRGGASYAFATAAHDLHDVWFRDDAGYVVGGPCTVEVDDPCSEPLIMRTIDGGSNWHVVTGADLVGINGAPVAGTLERLRLNTNGTLWAVGTGGLVVRSTDGATWTQLPFPVAADLNDIGCIPEWPWICMAVGDDATAYVTPNADAAEPMWFPVAVDVNEGGVLGRDFHTTAMVNKTVGYIGTRNMVLASFNSGADWTTLPLNYIENDARAIAVADDGGGYLVGGSAVNGRIWFLHDYHTQSSVQTKVFDNLVPVGSRITAVRLIDSNVTMSSTTIEVRVATDGDDWRSMGELAPPPFLDDIQDLTYDPRNVSVDDLDLSTQPSGRDFRVRLLMNTSGDRTITTAIVRGLHFEVDYSGAGGSGTAHADLDFSDADQYDAANSRGVWDTAIRGIRMPYIQEYWTRNVSGEVRDIQTGLDIHGDGYEEVWVATGGILSINSPDYILYAGSDESRYVMPDNRVYLLDGRTGAILERTDTLPGNVTHIRLADRDGDGAPDVLFATTYDPVLMRVALWGINPVTLDIEWYYDLGSEKPEALEPGLVPSGLTALVGTARTAADGSVGRVHHIRDHTPPRALWRVVPDDLGKYVVVKEIPEDWFFGAYVVEVEVEWQEAVVQTGVTQQVLRSARFYDHFMVTPPDALSPPAPVYNVHLVTWMDDWG